MSLGVYLESFEPHSLMPDPSVEDSGQKNGAQLSQGLSSEEATGIRSKTPLRLKYEAEVRVIRDQIGSIELIRQQLGLSQRKMCQLLMVDPSTWTRWMKDEARVPPHIYRSLQWYLQLIEKRPEWHPQNSFQPLVRGLIPGMSNNELKVLKEDIHDSMKKIRSQSSEFTDQFRVLTEKWNLERHQLLSQIEKKSMALTIWKLFVVLNFCLILGYLIFS